MSRRTMLLVAGLVVVAGCTRPSAAAYTTQIIPAAPTTIPAPVTSTPAPKLTVPPPEQVVITGAGFDLHAAGRVPSAAFDAAWAGVLATLNRYLEAGVLTPLRSGGPAGDLTPLFTPAAAERVMGATPDRGAFIDEGLPPLSDIRKDSAVAALTALAGGDGVMSVVTARLDLRLVGHANGAPVTVARTGELVLMPEGGSWRIDAYDLKVVRSVAGETTTTTAARS